ncbi:class I glutamine amidotransferase-like protein [Irpex rosettiformis]|uniref:Class I glutamine amidotransferase-like protein n=1 Tax=Irpex rosettiformis TaxID=378272 RepID=A0ACB8TYU2_9APHY|nr:class I glutamine amidotransferase-like protein [Irpex rosettiformis]
MTTIRLALFLCDTPIPKVIAQDGDYTVIFGELWRKSFPKDQTSVKYEMDSYDVRNKLEYPEDIDKYDGIVYTGSAASAYENVEWINKLVEYTAKIAGEKPHIKLIGICFGHQIIARALGEECVPNGGKWEIGPTTLQLTNVGKELFGVESLNIQQMHRDHVPNVPKSCLLLGSTSTSTNQGFIRYAPDAPASNPSLSDIQIFTVQGHPEFTERIVSAVVEARTATGVIDAATAEDVQRRAKWRNDGVDVIAKAVWKIFGVN